LTSLYGICSVIYSGNAPPLCELCVFQIFIHELETATGHVNRHIDGVQSVMRPSVWRTA